MIDAQMSTALRASAIADRLLDVCERDSNLDTVIALIGLASVLIEDAMPDGRHHQDVATFLRLGEQIAAELVIIGDTRARS